MASAFRASPRMRTITTAWPERIAASYQAISGSWSITVNETSRRSRVNSPCTAPVPPNRENNIRNSFQVPLAITPQMAWDTVTPPHWLFGTWARTVKNFGMPHFRTWSQARAAGLAKNLMRNTGPRDQLAWKHVELIRKK